MGLGYLPPEHENRDNKYPNLYPHHAPTSLADCIIKLKSLDVIPGGYKDPRYLWDKHDEEMYPRIKKIPQKQYGWPYDFREAEWKADAKDTFKRICLQFDPDYRASIM
ncbi:hypothetical protein BO78DRAFT_448382 [Aspergillus sclerotiicarbonarius CBS 121057]|uniref:Uncharacterized protein n=1 Tax=Aspergillus sclerotiicarbonarius (strain CBS 121057 / IBT 28362) TaxID=1448318 RepID=A0A319F5A1_ASPSB|nr:hypothetical protein BO78DRAFT_448382 [Aspergillus sclerotiicarbonarius CBS 121057]